MSGTPVGAWRVLVLCLGCLADSLTIHQTRGSPTPSACGLCHHTLQRLLWLCEGHGSDHTTGQPTPFWGTVEEGHSGDMRAGGLGW